MKYINADYYCEKMKLFIECQNNVNNSHVEEFNLSYEDLVRLGNMLYDMLTATQFPVIGYSGLIKKINKEFGPRMIGSNLYYNFTIQ
jgi:hypothetical protein